MPFPSLRELPVSVVITNHNYERYLRDCILSVQTQLPRPAEIVVIDDDSDSSNICKQLGVPRYRVNFRDVLRSRQYGYEKTKQPFVIFLDADDKMSPAYAANMYQRISGNRNVGIVYSDLQRFGEESGPIKFKDRINSFSQWEKNYIHAAAMFRRSAIEAVNPWDGIDPDFAEDYQFARKIMDYGFKAVKSPQPLLYRKHGRSLTTQRQEAANGSYYKSLVLKQAEVAVVTLFSGKWNCLERTMKFLEQEGDNTKIRVIAIVSAPDDAFHKEVKACLNSSLLDFVYHNAAGSVVPDARRQQDADQANRIVSGLYQTAVSYLGTTPFTLTLEDDVFPEFGVIERLKQHFNANVGAVFAPYFGRLDNQRGQILTFDEYGKPLQRKRHGVEQAYSGGFGCTLHRTHILKSHVFYPSEGERWFDPAYFKANNGWNYLVDWDSFCRHGMYQLECGPA